MSDVALVRVVGDGPIAELVRDELGSPGSPTALEVRIIEGSSPGLTSGRSVSGSRALLKHRVHADDQSFLLSLSARLGMPLYSVRLEGHPLVSGATRVEVHVDVASWSRIADPLLRVGSRDFATVAATVAKNLIYEVIDPLLWVSLLKSRSTLVHAGALRRPDGKALLLLGGGGVGKSTSVLALASHPQWGYLADDLAILGVDGQVRRHPKKLQVYAYNVETVPEAGTRLLQGRSRSDLALWSTRLRLLGAKQVRRRIDAHDLFGAESVADAAPLGGTAFLVMAEDRTEPELEPMTSDDAARLAVATMFEEEWDFLRFFNAMASLDAAVPTVSELYELALQVTSEALSQVPCHRLLVPPRTPGSALADLIQLHLQ